MSKSLEYIKSVLEEKTLALEQVEANPENYDNATLVYARSNKEHAEKWYNEALEKVVLQNQANFGAAPIFFSEEDNEKTKI